MAALPTNWRGKEVLPGVRPIMPRAPGRDRRLAGPVRMGLAEEKREQVFSKKTMPIL